MLDFPLIDPSVNIQTDIIFPNIVLRNDAGAEQRIVPHQSPLRQYSLSKNIMTTDEVETLSDFFDTIKGNKIAFLCNDFSDNRATYDPRTLATGVTTQGVVLSDGTKYQLFKKYVCGNNTHYRAIYWAEDLVLRQGGVTIGGTFIEGGEITGVSGEDITAEFTFKVPVRMTEDRLSRVLASVAGSNLYSLNRLTLKEVKHNGVIRINDVFEDDIEHTFALDFAFQATTSKLYSTEIASLKSGFDYTDDTQVDPITEIDFGQREILRQIDIEYLITLWVNTKGSGAFFDYDDPTSVLTKARFKQSGETECALTYTGQAGGNNPIYRVEGLGCRVFTEGIAEEMGYQGFVGSVLTICDCIGFDIPTPPPTELCIIGGTYETTLSLSPRYSDEPRETAVATFTPSTYEGDILTISNFEVDDFAFIVKPTYNVLSGYSLVGQTRTIVLPPDTFILYDGDNPNYASGSVSDQLTTNYIFNSQTVSIPGGQSTSVSEAIQGLIDIGVIGQPHNNIALSLLDQKGYVDGNGNIAFKIMLVEHGFGYITFNVSIPRCPGT